MNISNRDFSEEIYFDVIRKKTAVIATEETKQFYDADVVLSMGSRVGCIRTLSMWLNKV